MKPDRLAYALGWIAILIAAPAVAGSTLGTDELVPLLSQQPAVYAALRSGFVLSDSAWAEIRFGDSFPHLQGARLGPYHILAHARQSQQSVEVILCTRAQYFDKSGKILLGLARAPAAVRVRETLLAVMLRQPSEDRAACPSVGGSGG